MATFSDAVTPGGQGEHADWTQTNASGGVGFQGGTHHHYYDGDQHPSRASQSPDAPGHLRARIDASEQIREGNTLGAAEISNGNRIVNAIQRITLERRPSIVCVQSAGVTSTRLRDAEALLSSAGWAGTPRTWVAADNRCDLNDLRLLMQSVCTLGVEVGVVAYGADDRGGDLAGSIISAHRTVCAELALQAGPTVLVGTSWRSEPEAIRLHGAPSSGQDSVSIDEDLDMAHSRGELVQMIAQRAVKPPVALAAVARARAERGGASYEALATELLRVSSPSARRAWAVLSSGFVDPGAWLPTRDFLTVLIRGQHDPRLPLASLPPEILYEQALWDEILRRNPGPTLYASLLAVPAAARNIGLVDTREGAST